MTRNKVWFITGCSTGFGRVLAEELLAKGETVVATARKPEQLKDLVAQFPDRAIALALDVTVPAQVRAAVEQAIKTFGRIDVLVNNAGYGLIGALEEPTDEQIRRQFEVNVFGALDVMRAVLPIMRQQSGGHILNVSSMGGFCGFPGVGIYNATKFALEGLSEALAQEALHLGIKVTIVEPGAFRTDWAGRSLDWGATIADYESTVGQRRQGLKSLNGNQPGDPRKGAAAMIAIADEPNPPLRLVLGADAFDVITAKLKGVSAELETWQSLSVATAYTDAEAA